MKQKDIGQEARETVDKALQEAPGEGEAPREPQGEQTEAAPQQPQEQTEAGGGSVRRETRREASPPKAYTRPAAERSGLSYARRAAVYLRDRNEYREMMGGMKEWK